jgi:uncharacterized protein (TIGR03083 family)
MAEVNYREALVEQNRLFGDVFADADWSTPVPACPPWTLLQLFRHVGRGDRWAAEVVRVGDPGAADGGVDPRQVEGGRPPDDAVGAIEWLHAGPVTLLNAVTTAGPDALVWTFVGPRPAQWWIRRRLHEATVHRADAAFATGREYALEPGLAADAISERLEVAGGMAQSPSPPASDEQAVVLRATDAGLGSPEWQLAGRPASGPSGVVLTGPSVSLLLALYGRQPPQEAVLEVVGDSQLWEHWLSKNPF